MSNLITIPIIAVIIAVGAITLGFILFYWILGKKMGRKYSGRSKLYYKREDTKHIANADSSSDDTSSSLPRHSRFRRKHPGKKTEGDS